MYDFFYDQLKTLKARTGFNQWDKLQESKDPVSEIDALIKFMIEVCNTPPFNIVRQGVKQRVIARAVVEDQEFIGLNAKFVRKALNAWWNINGDRVLNTVNQKEISVYEPVELTKEQKEKIDVLANTYVARLLQGDGPKPVPKMKREEFEVVGKEWQSNLERKAVKYKDPHSPEWYDLRDKIRRTASEFYKDKYSFSGMQVWKVGEFEVFAESQSDAEEIIKQAQL